MTGSECGIEIRAGKMALDGSTIKSTGVPTEIVGNGSGSTTSGAGIAVAQHTTKLPLEVSISGGEVSGYTALSEANPQNNPAEAIAQVRLSITGGTFKAINGGMAALAAADCTGFVDGGYFSSEVPLAYCKAGKVSKTLGEGDTFPAGAPYTVATPKNSAGEAVDTFVAVKSDGSATVYASLSDVLAAGEGTSVYIAPEVPVASLAEQAEATTGTLKDPQDAT